MGAKGAPKYVNDISEFFWAFWCGPKEENNIISVKKKKIKHITQKPV
tara:strand:- start:9956 stop:10096 length:141 start_codon:yes stop_codon:yes gene_type:complete